MPLQSFQSAVSWGFQKGLLSLRPPDAPCVIDPYYEQQRQSNIRYMRRLRAERREKAKNCQSAGNHQTSSK